MRLIDADALREHIAESRKDAGFYSAIYDGFLNTIDRFPTIEADPVKHGRCPYCEGENNDFIPLNQTVEYSGIEMSLNRQGMLRVRVYEPGKATFTTQDIVEIKRCPNCGAKMDGERVALEEVVDIDAQTQRNNAAMRRVIDFVMDGGAENG